jgi:Transglutaminase-like superfamily
LPVDNSQQRLDLRKWEGVGLFASRRHPSRRVLAVSAAWLAVVTLASLGYANPAAPSSARADFLLSPQAAKRLVPEQLHPLLGQLEAPAADAVAGKQTTLGKALALERLVHTAVLPTGATCWGYATVMAALGRELGLPVRVTFVGTGVSDYDTHSTVSVWLPHYNSWGIVDPTFGGTFTRGSERRPLSAVDLRDSLVAGWWDDVRWRSSAPDSSRPSTYYVDPVFLFRYVGVYADVAGSTTPLVLPDSRSLADDGYIASPAAIANTPADRTLTARPPASAWAGLSTPHFDLPPAYAPREVWHGRTALPATISVPSGSIVVWSSVHGISVDQYKTTPVRRGSLSPVFVSDGKVRLTGHGPAVVRIYAARRFAASLES